MLSFTHLLIVVCFGFVFCVTSPWPYLIYFMTGSLSILILFTHFTQPHPTPPTAGNYQSVLCICEFGFGGFCFVLFLDSTYKRDHALFVFL